VGTDGHRGAVLVVSVWTGDGDLRARLTATDDLAGVAGPLGAAHGVDGICDAVRAWLESIDREGPESPDGSAGPDREITPPA
jgi:hypothetical protein